jgi:hypothetical protein
MSIDPQGISKAVRARQRAEKERKSLYQRAEKAITGHLLAPQERGPIAQLAILRQYVDQLHELQVRLSEEFGTEIKDEMTYLRMEIGKVLEEIVRLELELIKPVDKKPKGF